VAFRSTRTALFGRYRFTHVSPEVELRDANIGRTTLRNGLDTHSAVIGLLPLVAAGGSAGSPAPEAAGKGRFFPTPLGIPYTKGI
jgi:hypothetical protein